MIKRSSECRERDLRRKRLLFLGTRYAARRTEIRSKLLAIDDEPESLEIWEGHFARRGFLGWLAGDDSERSAILKKELPDKALLKLKMEKEEGDELARRVSKEKSLLKFWASFELSGVDAFFGKTASFLEPPSRIEEAEGIP